MYISVHPNFLSKHQVILKYAKTEIVDNLYEIEHPIIKNVLEDMKINGVEITCTADIPAGTGLGSSSTFTVGLIHTLSCYLGKYSSKARLAEKACDVEINRLKCPIGKQDQYAAALGGLNFIRFHTDGTVTYEPVLMNPVSMKRLQDNLLIFYLGTTRSTNSILEKQNENMKDDNAVRNLQRMCVLANEQKMALTKNDLSLFGELLHENWLLKRTLAPGISTSEIDNLYQKALRAGATGGKLLGAGGGGFLLLYCEIEQQNQLKRQMGLTPMPFRFEHDGTSVVYIGDKYWEDNAVSED
jgi:D-glycero-alpha-D-manno-heptose-7-phosphate kinase